MMKSSSLFFVPVIVLFAVSLCAGLQKQEVLVKFKSELSAATRDSLLQILGLRAKKEIRQLHVFICEIPETATLSGIQKQAEEISEIKYVEANVTYHALPQTPRQVEAKLHFKLDQLDEHTYQPDQILIKFKRSTSSAQIEQFKKIQNFHSLKYIEKLGVHVYHFRIERGMKDAVVAAAISDIVEYVEPNYIVYAFSIPDDPRFSNQWGLNNGRDTDVDAPEAWEIQTGDARVRVGIVDTGIDYNHEDLRNNYWFNPGEMGEGKQTNGEDDDQNGYVDDWRGWDFKNNDNNPMDDNGHGTHTAGIVAAEGNNGKGVSGVAWRTSLVGLKFLGADGSGTVGDAAAAIIYAADMGIKILSNSWGGTEYSRTLEDAVRYALDRAVLFVAAAGNSSEDNDTSPHYPSNLEEANVVSVAATDDRDRLTDFSNYGEKSVDLAAPGENILSTYLHNKYETLSGTSMAAPFVSGTAALVRAEFPHISLNQLKIRLLGSVDHISRLQGLLTSEGRLNTVRALSRSPIIALPTRLGNTSDVAGPYKISALVVDDGDLDRVCLIFNLNNSSRLDTLIMKPVGEDKFQAGIPGQPLGTTISYYILARDNETNRTRSEEYSFKVSETANLCCGGAAVSLGPENSNRTFAGFVLVSNLGLVFLPWGLYRIFRRIRK